MHPHRERYRIGERGALLGIFVNVALFVFKAFAGIVGQSSAIVADALHTASDLLTSVAVYVGFKIAAKPPDDHHPYGHGRAESIAAKIVSLVLIALGLKVLVSSFSLITSHDFHKPGAIALVAACVSIIVKYWLYAYVLRMGTKIKSTSLVADAYHHKSDAISSIAALIGVAAARLGLEFMDPAAGMIVAVLVIKAGVDNFHIAYDELMDAAPGEDLKNEIRKAVMETDGVLALKVFNVRKMGIDFHVDLTIEVDKDMTVEDGHTVTMKVKRSIIRHVPEARGILIHVEPFKGAADAGGA
ncbi:MAG: cation diffusion facilitator family transporter [Candidatus Omnitrophota bacterium]